MENKYTIAEILMNMHEGRVLFLKTDTMEILYSPFEYLKNFLPENPTEEDYEKLPSKEEVHIYLLPTYEFINHKSIMSEFTKMIYDNKEARKELFNILRYHDYLDKFYECLKKYDLYDEYKDYSSDYYEFVFNEWCLERNIEF
jgi:hypothetical protein